MKLNDEVTVGALTRMMKRGLEMLPFASQSPAMSGLFSVGAVGIVGLLIAMRESNVSKSLLTWASERTDASDDVVTVAGLQNLGNNCFLNATLQALASCRFFHSFLQSFRSNICLEEGAEEPPLAVTLESLLKGLCAIREERTVLNPRKVMLSMGIYVSNFNLTRQQDAAEALLHLLTSLEMEYLDHHEPFCSSLADIDTFSSSICKLGDGRPNKLRKWQQQILGPFDGTVGSMLVCTSCSSQLSMDFEVFRCLPLSPVLNGDQTIMDACSVEDCLNQYTVAEHIQSYHCSRCWHLNALKFLSLSAEDNNVGIKTISRCAMLGSCDCRNLLDLEIPDSSCTSNAFKQCCIARTPKILCLHLQRASISKFGEYIKLDGHISFPVVLDLLPFTITSKKVFLEKFDFEFHQGGFFKPQEFRPHIRQFNRQLSMHMARYVNDHGTHSRVEELPGNGLGHCKNNCKASSSNYSLGDDCDDQATMQDPTISTNQKWNEKVCDKSDSKAVTRYLYCLVAVVEHYGRCGSGHYAVYRRVHAITTSQCSPDAMKNLSQHWIYVSDSKVSRVSLETVLSAEASLLFYERIMQ